MLGAPPAFVLSQDRTLRPKKDFKDEINGFKELLKDGGLGESLLFLPSHLEKPVLNGLSDLLRLPQYPVLGVRAAALTGVRREGELYTQAQGGGKGGSARAQDGHKSGMDSCFDGVPGKPAKKAPATCAHPAGSRFRLARKGRSDTCSPQISSGTARSSKSRMGTRTLALKV